MKTEILVFEKGGELKPFLREVNRMPSMFNRKVKDSHVKNMVRSVKNIGVQRAFNVIRTDVFDGTMSLYFADSQHLSEAVLSIPDEELFGGFIVTITNMDSIDKIIPFVSLMNSTAKNWGLEDYLNAWVTHGLEDYEYLRNIRLKTGYGLSGLIEAFSSKTATGNADFKNGVFRANKTNGMQMMELYRKAVSMGLRDCNSAFLALVRFFISNPVIDEVKFLKGISREKYFGNNFNRDAFIALFKNINL